MVIILRKANIDNVYHNFEDCFNGKGYLVKYLYCLWLFMTVNKLNINGSVLGLLYQLIKQLTSILSSY